MVRAPDEFARAAQPYVCARITDMREVDLNFVRFDFDLTMAIVLMHADGTVYHRYGSRDGTDALSWTSVPTLVRLLDDTLRDHRAHERNPRPPLQRPALRPIDLPPLRQKLDAGKQLECVHCHTVHDTEHQHAVEQDTWDDDDKWLYPEPARVGLDLDPDDQQLVRAVAPGSAAARAGIRPGDRLVSIGNEQNVRTIADVQWALHHAAAGDAELRARILQGGLPRSVTLALRAGWKQCSPEDYAWRPFQWNLSPAPGFGGPMLDDAERQALAIPAGKFAFRVQYLVTWGPRAHRGRAAAAAGIQKGDIVVSFAGRNDFRSVAHWHAWVRLCLRAGQPVDVELLRSGERRTVSYLLPD